MTDFDKVYNTFLSFSNSFVSKDIEKNSIMEDGVVLVISYPLNVKVWK